MRILTTAVAAGLLGGALVAAQAPVPNPTNKTGVIGLMHAIHSTNDIDKTLAFYQAVFGMKTSEKSNVGRAITVGDGYVGLNINPKKAGRAAGLDHFGIEVEDAETVYDRLQRKYPTVKWLSAQPLGHEHDGLVAKREQA